jgi:predicted small metal-binding protein
MSETTELRYRCLEPGCGWTTAAASQEELVEAVQAHMAEAHDTFELEDVIIDAATVAGDAEPASEAKG